MTDLTGRGVQVLVIGTETHHGDALPSVPVVGRSFTALVDRLVTRCGVPPRQLTALHDPPDALAIARAVTNAAQQAASVLFVYFVGHGLRGPGGELHLAASGTDRLTPGLAAHQAYPVSDLREALTACRAPSIVVVLDCCFSGRARLGPPAADPLAELPPVHGVYLLSSAEQLASADPGREHTAFTGELIRFLDRGDPAAGRHLTLDDAYHHLFETLRARDEPPPQRREAGHAGRLVLADNPAHRPVTGADEAPVAPSAGPSPYRSLESFREQDAEFFFGREASVAELVGEAARRLTDPVPLLLLGPSGSGKTSLLHAGLLARVRRDGLAVGDAEPPLWPVVLPVSTPGAAPLTALARVLGGDGPEAVDRLAQRPQAAAELLDRRAAPGRPALVVVDQVEELYTLGAGDQERAAYLACLSALAAPGDDGVPRAVVVLALRADFYGEASQDPACAELLAGPRVVVGPMSAAELRRAIDQPAARAGLRIGDGLAELVLHELGTGRPRGPEPGALPLLSHVLWETWRRRVGNRLSVAGYRDSGGLNGAVAKTADDAYDRLTAAERAAARQLMLRLIRVGREGTDTARPVPRAELLHGLGPAAPGVLEQLTARRLVGIDPDGLVRISHETLLHSWPRLRSWITEDRARLVVRQQLADAAQVWQDGGRSRGDLLSGPRLAMTRTTLSTEESDRLSPLARSFLARSLRQRRLRRSAVAAVAVLLVLLGSGALVAVQQRARADRLDAQNAARRMAAQAEALRESRPAAALALSLSAYHSAVIPESRQALYAAYAEPRPVEVAAHREPVLQVAYTPDSRTLVSSGGDHRIRLWDVSDPRRPAGRGVIERAANTAVAVSPDGRHLFGGGPETFSVWDVSDPGRPVERATRPTPPSQTFGVAVAPGGATVATAGDGGALRLWDVRDPGVPGLLASRSIDRVALGSVAFSPDGGTLAVAHGIPEGRRTGGKVSLWDVRDPRRPARLVELAVPSADAVAFNPAGATLAAGGAGGEVSVWDVTTPRRPRPLPNNHYGPSSGDGSIFSLSYRPDGGTFATASTTGRVKLWRLGGTDDEEVQSWNSLPGTEPVRAVAFGPDGGSLAVADDAGVLRVWSATAPLLAGHLDVRSSPVPGGPFGFEGRYVLSNTGYGAPGGARLWDVGGPRPVLVTRLPPQWGTAAFLPDDRTVISRNRDTNALRLWDLTDPRRPAAAADVPLPTSPEGYASLAVTPDSHHFAVGDSERRTIRLLDVRDRHAPTEAARFDNPENVSHLWFLDDGLLAVWGRTDIQLWDVRNPSHPVRAGVLPGAARTGALLYERTRKVAFVGERDEGTEQSATRLWALADPYRPRRAGAIVDPQQGGSVMITDAHTVVVGTDLGVRSWDVTDLDHPVAGPALAGNARLRQLDLGPDGRTLVGSAGGLMSKVLEIWRRDDPRDLFTRFAVVPGDLAEFAPDGGSVLGTLPTDARMGIFAPEGGAAVWSLDTDLIYRELCAAPPDPLPDAEWRLYFPDLPRTAPCP
jgi:WD40 repeat protein